MVDEHLLDGVLVIAREVAVRGVVPGDTKKIHDKEDDVHADVKPNAVKVVLGDDADNAGSSNGREKSGKTREELA